MARLEKVDPKSASGDLKAIFEGLQKQIGMVPNIFAYMATSPQVLKAYIGLNQAVDHTSLSPKLREKIALVVSQGNQCNYCLAAHTAAGKAHGFKESEAIDARTGKSSDKKEASILQFAKKIVDKKGVISKEDFEELKGNGLSDKEIGEVFLVVMATFFTNYFNELNDTPIDFPAAPKL